MKTFLVLSLLTLSSFSFASWKKIADTTVCDEKIQIFAEEGKPYVIAVNGGEKKKLFSKDGSIFSENSMKMTEYTSERYIFLHPSYVEANPPKIIVDPSGIPKRCKMQHTP